MIGNGPDNACCWIEFELELDVNVPAELMVSAGEIFMLDIDVVNGRIGTWTLSLDCRLSGVWEGVPFAGVSAPAIASSGCCIGVKPKADAARLVGRLPRRLDMLDVEDCVRCNVVGRRGLGLTPATRVD